MRNESILLPGGVTGFYDRGDEALPVTDVAGFRGHCHEAARRADGRVVSVTHPYQFEGLRNYAVGVLALPAGEVAVVLNAHHPIVAFAAPLTDGEPILRFRDCPELAAEFESFGVYRVMPAAEMERRPLPAELSELSDVERGQMAYWKPTRIGDVVFNWWD